MAIKYVDGDLLLATENIMGHQVNCQAVMGAGVAYQIREAYRQAYLDYMTYCRTKSSKDLLGSCQIVKINESRFIANLFGQDRFGGEIRHTNYVALSNSLTILKYFAKSHNLTIALPYKVGCDRGGGDWEVVSALIDDVFFNYEVTLYKFEK